MGDAPNFCCPMREKFLVGIVMENQRVADPPDLCDFIDFEDKDAQGRPIIRIRFCPFCGAKIGAEQMRVADIPPPALPGDEWKDAEKKS